VFKGEDDEYDGYDEGEDGYDVDDYDGKDRHDTSRVKYTDPSSLDSSASAIEVIKAWSHRLKGIAYVNDIANDDDDDDEV
jgi:hypothetical protein